MGIFSRWKPILYNDIEHEYQIFKQANVKQNISETTKKEVHSKKNLTELKQDRTNDCKHTFDFQFFSKEFRSYKFFQFLERTVVIGGFVFMFCYAIIKVVESLP